MARKKAVKGYCARNGALLWLHLFSTKAAQFNWITQKELYLCIENGIFKG
jgi:hypothetical protein